MKTKLSALFICSLTFLCVTGCSENKEIKHTRIERVDEYTLDVFDSDNPIKESGEKRNFDFFNDRTIPYLSIEEYTETYANYIANSKEGAKTMSKYVVYTSGKISAIINSHNNTRCIIDYDKQTATFDSYSGFLAKSLDSSGPGDYVSTSLDDYYFLEKSYEYQKGVDVVVNFKNYNIDSYFYNDKIYLPIHFMNVLLGTSTPLGVGGIYYNGHRSYLLGGVELAVGMFDELYQEFLKDIRKDDTTLNDDYMEYNYNVLCFTLDFHYGLDKRHYRSTNQDVYFNKNGAYETLKDYKDRLMSRELGVFDDALIDLFNNEFNDGGHSKPAPISVTQDKDEPKVPRTGETKFTLDTNSSLIDKRKEVLGFDFDTEEGLKNQYVEMEYEDTKIAYVTFDSFSISISAPTLDVPYYAHTFNLINYANEQIKKNNIKNVVIDLSCNVGGIILAEEMVESWICGASHSTEYNRNDKSITKISRKADINHDKLINENDFLGDDVNVYCIISPSSFSCGNLLPARLKEYSNTKFIGSRSGGGSCSVETNINLPNGAFISISSVNNAVLKDSTIDNPITVENGVEGDFIKIEEGPEHYAEFFQRNEFNKLIVNNNI